MSASACWLLLALSTPLGGAPKDYPRQELLVDVSQLTTREEAKKFDILDARAKNKYDKGHVPGAVWVDHEAWSKAFAKSQDPKEWENRIGALGLRNIDKILIYDDAMQKDAARIWWILRYFGHKDARLLNGGIQAWTAAKLPASTEAVTLKPAKYRIESPRTDTLAGADDILAILKKKNVQIIDTRSEKEHCGDEKLKNKRGGAIPGAMHLEWTDAIDKESRKFKSPAQLAAMFKAAGIDVGKPSVTHCQSGGRAAVMAFTLELMGADQVANYYRGWSEWGNRADAPVVTPTKKGK